MKNYEFEKLKVTIPSDWCCDQDGDVINIYDPEKGLGVVQISNFDTPKISIDLREELADFVADFMEIDIKDEVIFSSLFENGYAYVELSNDKRYWFYLVLRKDDSITFVTYNCAREDRGLEENVLWGIVHSLVLK